MILVFVESLGSMKHTLFEFTYHLSLCYLTNGLGMLNVRVLDYNHGLTALDTWKVLMQEVTEPVH